MKNTFASLAIVTSFGLIGFAFAGGCKATVTTGEAVAPAPSPTPAPTPTEVASVAPSAEPVAPVEEKKVSIVGNEVTIKEKIMFDVGKATIKAESNGLLDEIANVIKTDGATIDLIEVGGHADKQGNEKENLKLTDERAKAVVDALTKRGVDGKKLRAKGYGQYCPIDTGSTPDAYEKNRRVEFKILKMGGKATGAVVGCDEAVKHGIKPAPVI